MQGLGGPALPSGINGMASRGFLTLLELFIGLWTTFVFLTVHFPVTNYI